MSIELAERVAMRKLSSSKIFDILMLRYEQKSIISQHSHSLGRVLRMESYSERSLRDLNKEIKKFLIYQKGVSEKLGEILRIGSDADLESGVSQKYWNTLNTAYGAKWESEGWVGKRYTFPIYSKGGTQDRSGSLVIEIATKDLSGADLDQVLKLGLELERYVK